MTDDPLAVRHERLDRVRRAMELAGVDALLLGHGADLPWLTGVAAMPLERLTLLVLPVDGPGTLVVPELEAPRMAAAADLVELVPWAETDDPVAIVVGRLLAGCRRPMSGGDVLELAFSDRGWAVDLLRLQRAVAGRWRPASAVTGPLRAVKDASEVAALRAAAAAADTVAASLQHGEVELVGRTEAEVSADIGRRLLAAGHDRVNFAIVGSGPNGASPHHDAGPRRLTPGDVVVCDFGGTLSVDGTVGYCSDITRTLSIGAPTADVAATYAVLLEAQQAGVAAVRPGATAGAIDAAARSVIAAAGLGDRFIHRTGHGIGIEEHEPPYLVAGDETELVPGHAFSVEPGIYLPGRFGMRLEDIVVVTDDGVEPLNRAAHELAVCEP